jgi:hypothetical protein
MAQWGVELNKVEYVKKVVSSFLNSYRLETHAGHDNTDFQTEEHKFVTQLSLCAKLLHRGPLEWHYSLQIS